MATTTADAIPEELPPLAQETPKETPVEDKPDAETPKEAPPKKKPSRRKSTRASTDPDKPATPRRTRKKPAAKKPAAQSKTTPPALKKATWRKGGEIMGLILVSLSLGLVLSLVSFHKSDLLLEENFQNLIGPIGAYSADILLYVFGVGAFFFVGVVFLLGGFMLIGKKPDLKPSEFVGHGLLVVIGAILFHLLFKGEEILDHMAGGLVGSLLGDTLAKGIGTVGAYIAASSLSMLAIMLITDKSLGNMLLWTGSGMKRGAREMSVKYKAHREFQRQLKEMEPEEDFGLDEEDFDLDEAIQSKAREKMERHLKKKTRKTQAPQFEEEEPEPEKPKRKRSKRKATPKIAKKDTEVDIVAPPYDNQPAMQGEFVLGDTLANLENVEEPSLDTGFHSVVQLDDEAPATQRPIPIADHTPTALQKKPAAPKEPAAENTESGPQIVETEAQKQAREMRKMLEKDHGPVQLKRAETGDFELPPVSFLNYNPPDDVGIDADRLREMAGQLEEKLASFGVQGSVVEICPGPVITMFEFSPAPGVKLSKIANLSDDLAMALSAYSVRIIAPIPGKGVVGIEVPNDTREMVFLKEIIADEKFQSAKAKMPMALGKNTEGGPVITDLASMPHLLVAGATGSGKSVAVNTMIVSLLYQFTPDQVRLLMVDPKMLEFSIYEGIPHLLLPVVTDPSKAAVALGWAVNEMERRYQLLAEMSVRNITSYNKRVDNLTQQVEEDLANGLQDTEAIKRLQIDSQGNPTHKRLPFIVCIIDEFADLMMVASKDVETCVARLAQKARAAGIHLILATQRPSVDVITGLIKANFPTRIALRVAQRTDSRTILDSNGAENLLGKGDMLFLPPGSSQQQRVHGAFVSEDEIERMVNFLKEQGEPEYDESILLTEDDKKDTEEEDEPYDELYDKAIFIVTSERQASISMVQRKLRIGYNRAARMIERMERDGVVGPSDGSKPRAVLAPPPQ